MCIWSVRVPIVWTCHKKTTKELKKEDAKQKSEHLIQSNNLAIRTTLIGDLKSSS